MKNLITAAAMTLALTGSALAHDSPQGTAPAAGDAVSDPASRPVSRAVAGCVIEQDTSFERTEQTPDELSLVGPEWFIEDIAGRGVIDNSAASMTFLFGGSLAGNASCNRMLATYEQSGGGVSISLSGTTMMACPPALERQERHLLELLPQVVSYEIDATGTLILRTAAGESITARCR